MVLKSFRSKMDKLLITIAVKTVNGQTTGETVTVWRHKEVEHGGMQQNSTVI
jgi:hypothetical protein